MSPILPLEGQCYSWAVVGDNGSAGGGAQRWTEAHILDLYWYFPTSAYLHWSPILPLEGQCCSWAVVGDSGSAGGRPQRWTEAHIYT